MTFINNNFQKKESIFKPILIVLAIIVVIGAIYHFFGDKNQAIAGNSDLDQQIANWIDKNPQKILASVEKFAQEQRQKTTKNASKNIKNIPKQTWRRGQRSKRY